MSTATDPFLYCLRVLRRELPCAFPVQVRRVTLKNHEGWAKLDGYGTKKKFIVRIAKSNCIQCEVDTLVHEWAHCRAHSYRHDNVKDEDELEMFHDGSWGLAYAECYRVAMKALEW